MTKCEFIYRDLISDLYNLCQSHIDGLSTADQLQRMVQRAETEIVAIEEKDIREKMTDVEGQLELIRFTIEEQQQLSETRKIALQLIEWLELRERRSRGHVEPRLV